MIRWWVRRSGWQRIALGAGAVFLSLAAIGSAAGYESPPRELAPSLAAGATSTIAPSTTAPPTTSIPPTTVPAQTSTSTSTTTAAPTPTTSSTSSTSSTTTAAATTTTLAALPPGAERAEVISITDGDTARVKLPTGAIEPVRLIGINAPEGGECYAPEATAALTALARGEVIMTSDVSDRDRYDRLLRYLWTPDGDFINEILVRDGYALARDYPPDSEHATRLAHAQSAAKDGSIGLWAPDACGPAASADIGIGYIEYDAPGNDHENLNGEWVEVTNHGTAAQAMGGWVLKDESASHRYRFPSSFTLDPGSTVRVFTGCGPDSVTELHWCNGSAVWNNDGDTAFILDPNGNIVAQKSY